MTGTAHAHNCLLFWLLDNEGTESDIYNKCTLMAAPIGGSIKIAENMDFEFIRTATPRWPDMLAIYIPQRKILFSSELFSAHVASELTEVKVSVSSLSEFYEV